MTVKIKTHTPDTCSPYDLHLSHQYLTISKLSQNVVVILGWTTKTEQIKKHLCHWEYVFRQAQQYIYWVYLMLEKKTQGMLTPTISLLYAGVCSYQTPMRWSEGGWKNKCIFRVIGKRVFSPTFLLPVWWGKKNTRWTGWAELSN